MTALSMPLREVCVQASSRPSLATKHVQGDAAIVVNPVRILGRNSQACSEFNLLRSQPIGHTDSRQDKTRLKVQNDGFFKQRGAEEA
jgi:hypothetical protein